MVATESRCCFPLWPCKVDSLLKGIT